MNGSVWHFSKVNDESKNFDSPQYDFFTPSKWFMENLLFSDIYDFVTEFESILLNLDYISDFSFMYDLVIPEVNSSFEFIFKYNNNFYIIISKDIFHKLQYLSNKFNKLFCETC